MGTTGLCRFIRYANFRPTSVPILSDPALPDPALSDPIVPFISSRFGFLLPRLIVPHHRPAGDQQSPARRHRRDLSPRLAPMAHLLEDSGKMRIVTPHQP